MKRSRIKPVSAKAQAFRDELAEVRPLVEARAQHMCEVCRERAIEHIHHRLRRSQGGTNQLANLLGVCWTCHWRIHAYPTLSYEAGLLVRHA